MTSLIVGKPSPDQLLCQACTDDQERRVMVHKSHGSVRLRYNRNKKQQKTLNAKGWVSFHFLSLLHFVPHGVHNSHNVMQG